ncbi:DoxX family protein [Aggregatimonas sangjinii]|uniref:DoxX family protein n=1 Tax=Aggregatimonas sangjinii TaxID=2583587 RepID=A0A5B7SMZ2_9FLAO|nr:DoxX family protein [Aggregatimonas sangjinii]QCW99925.1 DoxX family protein [Aggregatimonas sangjinii]
MNYITIALQCIVAISILNVWLVQNKKATQWRGGNATTIIEEFEVYGLPVWMCYVIGTLKVLFALGLIAAIWYPELKEPSAIGLAVLLMGSIAMHIKISDPIKKSFPAFLFLCMCVYIAFSDKIVLS